MENRIEEAYLCEKREQFSDTPQTRRKHVLNLRRTSVEALSIEVVVYGSNNHCTTAPKTKINL